MKLKTRSKKKEDGVILLLVVIMLTAIFSISIGVFSVIIGQISISETFENSGIALYAADQGNERTLYRDRIEHDFAIGRTPPVGDPPGLATASGGCIYIIIEKTTPTDATITVRGLSTLCPPTAPVTERTVARAFLTTY